MIHVKYFVIFILLILLVLIYYIFSSTNVNFSSGNYNEIINMTIPKKYFHRHFHTFGFYPINDKGIYSFMNVCIETSAHYINRSVDHLGIKYFYTESKKIHIYNSFLREGAQTLNVATSGNSAPPWNTWDIIFHHSGIPKDKIFIPNTAFFVSQTCPSNLHHFWTDEFIPLYSVIRKANRLLSNSTNFILYRRPILIKSKNAMEECFNVFRYQDFLSALYVYPSNHYPYFEANSSVCYSSGVFGHMPIELIDPRQAINHVLNYTFGNTVFNNNFTILFLQRSLRRIINLSELIMVVKRLGLDYLVYDFENISVKKQMEIVSHCKIFVGVQGAGLQWAVFMPKGSTLIEIAWPHHHWGFYYEQYMKPYLINYKQLIAANVKINWTSYEHKVRGGVKVELDERVQLMEEKPKTGSLDNVWKWADVIVNVNHFKDILNSALY